MGATVSFFTTVGQDNFVTGTAGVPGVPVRRDMTMLRIDAPVAYNINQFLGLEFGVRSNLRGPPVSQGLSFDVIEFWAYGALRIVFDPKDKKQGWNH
jgi:hypothetical protein